MKRKQGGTPAQQTYLKVDANAGGFKLGQKVSARFKFVADFRRGSKTDRTDPRPFLPVTVCGKRKVKCVALVDTGADAIYVSPGLIRKAGLKVFPLHGKASSGWDALSYKLLVGGFVRKAFRVLKSYSTFNARGAARAFK